MSYMGETPRDLYVHRMRNCQPFQFFGIHPEWFPATVEPARSCTTGCSAPPFADGNGRTGKILHNWLLGTLNDPVLVTDYFGGGNP